MPFVAVPPPRQTTGAREQKKRAQETSYSGKGRALALGEGERKVEVMGLRQRREEKGCAPEASSAGLVVFAPRRRFEDGV